MSEDFAPRKHWIVMQWKSKGMGSRPDPVFFGSRKEADEEATRLAMRNIGLRYVIFEAVGAVMLPLPAALVQELD